MSERPSLESVQFGLEASPFICFLGIRLRSFDAKSGSLEAELPFRPEFERLDSSGQHHGGVISAFIDTVGDYAVVLLEGTEALPTLNFRVDFLRPGWGDLIARTQVRRVGRTVALVDVDVVDAYEKLVATGRCVYAMPK
jgi:uncharacterized protein (TIGR00369 family)